MHIQDSAWKYLWEWAIASHGRVLVPLVAHELYIMVVLLLSAYTDYFGGKLFILQTKKFLSFRGEFIVVPDIIIPPVVANHFEEKWN